MRDEAMAMEAPQMKQPEFVKQAELVRKHADEVAERYMAMQAAREELINSYARYMDMKERFTHACKNFELSFDQNILPEDPEFLVALDADGSA